MFFLDEKIMQGITSVAIWWNGNEFNFDEKAKQEMNLWKEQFDAEGEILKGGVLRENYLSVFTKKIATNQSIDGISTEFSRIKNSNQLIEFASNYGNLGLTIPQTYIDLLKEFKNLDPSYSVKPSLYENAVPGLTYFEPFELWFYQVNKVRKILKLYRALCRHKKGEHAEIEENILRIGEETKYKKESAYKIEWYDGSPTLVTITESELENTNFYKIGQLVLRKSIERYVSKGIEIKASEIIETEKNNLGFYVLEKKTTQYLITAIYYDLWQLINTNLVVETCENPKCKLPFVKIKRGKYCSDACKQEAYRIRRGITSI